jgi:putative aldouronate transport system substrate-binding protein
MTMTPEESTRAAELQSAISTFVGEAAVQFMTGQTNIATWDSYVARVNSMGLPELLKIYQAAYDRYLAR